jgi:hypothetical protein
LAFVIALVWTTNLRGQFHQLSQKNLVWLLAAASIFAWGNYGYTLGQLYVNKSCNLGCPEGYFGVSYFTVCLVGAVIFTLALMVALRLRRQA